jgi:hypothetical protein
MRTQKVRIIDLERKRRLTVDAYVKGLRCVNCGAKFPASSYAEDEPRQCLYCGSLLEPSEWRVRWDKRKWEKYFDKVREELGLGWSYYPHLVKDENGQFHLQFIATVSPLMAIVDQRLLPIEVEFRQ